MNFIKSLSDCGHVPTTSHGSYSVTSTTYLSTATAHCDPGYDLKGSSTVTCQANKTWTAQQARCDPKGMSENENHSLCV